MDPPLNAAPAISGDTAWVELDGEVVVLEEPTGALHVLNPTAAVLWQCFDGHSTVREIADDLAAVVENADVATIRRDVGALVGELAQKRLVELRHGSEEEADDRA